MEPKKIRIEPRRPLLLPPKSRGRKRKSLEEKVEARKEYERYRAQRRLNIGDSYDRWKKLRNDLGLKTDAETANFLLNSYERSLLSSTPVKVGFQRPPAPAASTTSSASDSARLSPDPCVDIDENQFNDIKNSVIDWDSDDETWLPDVETELSSVEEISEEEDDDDDYDDDTDYVPNIRVKTGGALQSKLSLDTVPVLSIEDTVHDEPHSEPAMQTALPKDSLRVIDVEDVQDKKSSIVYHDSLLQLARTLHLPIKECPHRDTQSEVVCKATGPFGVTISSRGTAAVVEWKCPHGHILWTWLSQPHFEHGMMAGDFSLSMNILLSGNNFRKIALMFDFMKLGMVDRSSFYLIQDAYCVDTVQEFWTEKRGAIITQLQSQGPIVVLGDARMDSPGFSAQYCTYTAMDNQTKQIINMVNINKRQTKRNSVAMEKEAFIQTLETLKTELDIMEFCTDAHKQISALFNTGKYKDCGIKHTLDMWHASKSLAKKIHTAGQQKGCEELLNWTQDICNHFWFCCKSADTYDEFFDMWSGVLHHVTGEHEWILGACQHGQLAEDQDMAWLIKGSEAHLRLTEMVLDARWLKNVHKLLNFRSTAELEAFHNHLLMYASKRFSFTAPVYAARVMLAGLDYNHHIKRPPKRGPDGSLQYGKVFNKKSRKWSLYVVKEKKDYSYIRDLQSAIWEKRLRSSKVPRQSKKRPDDPRSRGVLSGVPPPTTAQLLQTQVSRGQRPLLPK